MRTRGYRWIGMLGLTCTAFALPALAQQPSGPGSSSPQAAQPAVQYPKCDKQVTDRDSEAAHGAYQAGKAAYDEGDYPKALTYFNDAYKRDCNKHELLIIISRAYELKGDKPEAVRALRTYLDRAPSAPDAEAQRTKISNLEKQIQQEKAAAAASAASAASAQPTASAPPRDEGGGHTVPPWIVVGIGGALVATGVAVQLIGEFKVRDAEGQCPNHDQCPPANGGTAGIDYAKVRDTGEQGRTLAKVGFALWVTGVVAVGGGLAWHFLEPTGSRDKARVVPAVGPGYAGAQLGGSF